MSEVNDKQFAYDEAVEDFLKDIPISKSNQNGRTSFTGRTPVTDPAPVKNVDEEVVVRKKRAPVAKLDETRLLSNAGIPKLRKIARTRLKFKGKGHEFSDISRLLNTYQLWLDDLYPRAKFRDALTMVEKLGHSKRMQVTRRAWLDETKPKREDANLDRLEDSTRSGALKGDQTDELPNESANGEDDIFGENTSTKVNNARGGQSRQGDVPSDDDLDALLAESVAPVADPNSHQAVHRKGPFEEEDGGDEGDDLDAFLAEQADAEGFRNTAPVERQPEKGSGGLHNDFADEEEIMAEMDW